MITREAEAVVATPDISNSPKARNPRPIAISLFEPQTTSFPMRLS